MAKRYEVTTGVLLMGDTSPEQGAILDGAELEAALGAERVQELVEAGALRELKVAAPAPPPPPEPNMAPSRSAQGQAKPKR